MGLPQYLGEMEIWQETATKAEARTKQVRKQGLEQLVKYQLIFGWCSNSSRGDKKNSRKILLATLKKNFNVRDNSKLDYHKALFGN